ncbi:MAG: hypothetical protein H6834_05600 [Planctomycetes bacterium]|nr:hypothetical protein [Planctomycetota bacterium]
MTPTHLSNPVTKVHCKPFLIAKCEVTNAQYDRSSRSRDAMLRTTHIRRPAVFPAFP